MKKKAIISLIILLIIGLVIYLLSKDTDKDNNNSNSNEEEIVDEKRDGKELTIYKFEYKYYPKNIYYDVKNELSDNEKDNYEVKEVGKITCKSKDCKYEEAGNDYVLVEEYGGYSLYKYTLLSILSIKSFTSSRFTLVWVSKAFL